MKILSKNITGIVIAGGKSSRMGQNKALVYFKDKRLIDNAIQILEVNTYTILISSNEIIPNAKYPIIVDEYNNIGPMGGLFTCLKTSKTELNLVIPCDVPLLDANLYKKLIENSEGFDAVVPRLPNGKIEPLIACYRKSILPIILGQIELKDYKLVHLLEKLSVNYISFEDTEPFKNMNSPTDLL